jgi:hypothetical protein
LNLQGIDCAGPTCTAGGDCDGPNCTRGGDCTGPKCDHGGHCEGPHCHRGGSCWGLHCHRGGGCTGPICAHGGGCGPLGCPPGDCIGPECEKFGDDDDNDDDDDDGKKSDISLSCLISTNEKVPDYSDTNDPNRSSSRSEECTTSTFSSCRTLCIAGSMSCTSSTTTCSDVIGCDTSGTSWASTVTPAPAAIMGPSDTWTTGADDPDYDVSVATSIIAFLSGIGDFGSMGAKPTPTGPTSVGPSSTKPTSITPISTGTDSTSGMTSPLPTLTNTAPIGPPYSGMGCATYTATVVCNGSGEQSACETETLCVPTAPKWSTSMTYGSVTCADPNAFCVSTTVYEFCEETGGAVGKRMYPAATTTHNTPAESPIPKQLSYETKPKPSRRPGLPDLHFKNEVEQRANSSVSNRELLPRQDGGLNDNGCSYAPACVAGYCATASFVPCLQATINAQTGGVSGTDVTASVTEDGVLTCQTSAHCSIINDVFDKSSACAGTNNYDCGNGNSMVWKWNTIEYTSKKYNATYPLYLPRTVSDKITFCFQDVGAMILPAACIEDDFAYQTGPCQNFS